MVGTEHGQELLAELLLRVLQELEELGLHLRTRRCLLRLLTRVTQPVFDILLHMRTKCAPEHREQGSTRKK